MVVVGGSLLGVKRMVSVLANEVEQIDMEN